MARYIDADELKKHIRWDLLRYGSNYTIDDCKVIDKVIDAEQEIKVFDRDNGEEPILETTTSVHHELRSSGHGEFVSKTITEWHCPQCGYFVGELYSGYGKWHIQGETSFCAKCGQRIDWTKPKEEEKRRYEEERKRNREEWEKKNGCRLDNMNERRRIKYGIMERSKDGEINRKNL